MSLEIDKKKEKTQVNKQLVVYKSNVVKHYCHHCLNKTNQKVLFSYVERDVQEIFIESLKGEPRYLISLTRYKFTKCNGCEFVNLMIETEHIGRKSKVNTIRKSIPGNPFRKFPTWMFCLDKEYIEILVETYNALNGHLFTLALMGVRTTLDIFIVKHIGDVGNFKVKMDKMLLEGYVSSDEKEILLIAIDAGNASVHRGYKPNEKEINSIFNILENLLQKLVIKKESLDIKSNLPKRLKTV